MTRDQVLMQGLRAKLTQVAGWIQRATYAKRVDFSGGPGEFEIVVSWVDKDGSEGSYRHPFTNAYVFGETYKLSVHAWSVHKCAMDFARDVVREVLNVRLAK